MKIEIKKDVIETAYDHALCRGFPYYKFHLTEKYEEFEKLCKYNSANLLDGENIKQTMHSLGLAWSYFSHHWEVKIKNQKTPMDIWFDRSLLKKAIERRLKRGGLQMLLPDGSMTDSQLRKALRSYSGVQSVSNFRPTAAACIYRHFAGDGVVWDMSCGFGGRLLGAMSSGAVRKYIGTDPSNPTFIGLTKMASDFSHLDIDVQLNKVGSEFFVPGEKVDLCFTSPPYFDTEMYIGDETQSFRAYDSLENWNEQFLRKTIKNCKSSLKSTGIMILNVANVKNHPMLENDTLRIASEEGFFLEKTYRMLLSNISKGGYKSEPVFVFKL